MCADANSVFDEALSLNLSTPKQVDRVLADLTRRSQSLFEQRTAQLSGQIVAVERPASDRQVQTDVQIDETVDAGSGSPLLERCPELLLVNCDSADAVLAFAEECCATTHPLPNLSHHWHYDVAALLRPDDFRDRQKATGLDGSAASGWKPAADAGGSLTNRPLTCLADFVGLPLDPVPSPGQATAGSEYCCAPVPHLVEEGRRGFNIVEFHGRYFALAQSLGPIDVAGIDDTWLAGRTPHQAIVNQILVDLVRMIDELPEPVSPVAGAQTGSTTATLLPAGPDKPARWVDALRPRLGRRLAQILSRIPRGD
jgi:hypothetical protein